MATHGCRQSSRSESPLSTGERTGKALGKPDWSPLTRSKVCEGAPGGRHGLACATTIVVPASRPTAAPDVVTFVRQLPDAGLTSCEHATPIAATMCAVHCGTMRRSHCWLSECAQAKVSRRGPCSGTRYGSHA